ncbi:MAG: nucleotide exchange factor GrpE [Candidatus Delongbacteria bacterium]|nr:nucleotide exchange factor GrpE [bacterium]MBL7033524.1 nucleotide exchange factor GrpE [Candidatus Delongbacteria bacterium]
MTVTKSGSKPAVAETERQEPVDKDEKTVEQAEAKAEPVLEQGDATPAQEAKADVDPGVKASAGRTGRKAASRKKSARHEAAAIVSGLEQQIAELNDRLLRKIAEFDNYRKRTAREQINLLESAAGPLMLKLLPVLDDMEQLEKLTPAQATATALLEGLTLIHKKINDILLKEGLEPIPATGEQFNPELHEVLAVMEDDTKDPGVILVDQQRGYRLRGHILRHSRVVINKETE